jgi:ATP-dependent DNA helicase RecG
MPLPVFHPENPAPAPLEMSAADFSRAFPAEGQHIERKSGTSSRPLREAVVAFSNSEGGVVLIGVDDKGRVLGKPLTQGVEESIHQAIAAIRNPGRYSIQSLLVDDGPITVLSVERRVQGFAQTSSGRVLVRRGAMNAALFDADLFRFISERSLEQFELSDAGASVSDADGRLVTELSQAFAWGDTELRERLEEQGLVIPGTTHLTVAGALYLLEQPDDIVAKAFVEIRRFADAQSIDPDKRIEVKGPIHHQVAAATRVIAEELGSESVVLGLRRHDLPRLPEVVVREALANAVAHRIAAVAGDGREHPGCPIGPQPPNDLGHAALPAG